MGEIAKGTRGLGRAVAVVAGAGMLAACSFWQGTPAPVELRGSAPMAALPPAPIMREITVKSGQSLGAIAHANHVPAHDIAAANHLKPPYTLKAGMHLMIPDHGMMAPPPMATASGVAPPKVAAAIPLAPPPTMHPTPLPPASPQVVAPAPTVPPQAAARLPDVVPLDGPPPAVAPKPAADSSGPPPVLPPRNAAAALPLPGEETTRSASPPPSSASPPPAPMAAAPVVAQAPLAADPSALSSGRFPWPVHGRVLTAYGNAPDGTHNDGINIGAARGTPVRSIDAGTVAYVGNEVHGYGNLVLVKHANGWISAYAHLDDVAVKLGDQIGGGAEIGKVGNSGGVAEPQLHFELRRGKKPVDPRAFLVSSPSAANPTAPKG